MLDLTKLNIYHWNPSCQYLNFLQMISYYQELIENFFNQIPHLFQKLILFFIKFHFHLFINIFLFFKFIVSLNHIQFNNLIYFNKSKVVFLVHH